MSTIGKITWAVAGGLVGIGSIAATVHGGISGNGAETGVAGATLAGLVLVLWRKFA